MDTRNNILMILDNTLEGCQIIGFNWDYRYINTTAALQGRKTKEELIGKTIIEVYPGIEQTEMFHRLKQCMERRISVRMENEFTYQDGSKAWFQLRMEPVLEGVFIFSNDITKEKTIDK